MVEPAVATAAYAYHGSRLVETRIATRISGPPKVGTGELSRIARKKSPNAPKWRNMEKIECPRFELWRTTLSIGRSGGGPFHDSRESPTSGSLAFQPDLAAFALNMQHG